jgi:hypothetical protein
MAKNKKEKKEVRFCPLLNKLCIQEDCGWYMLKLDTCAVQVIPYNLYQHSNKLEECSRNYDHLLDHLTRPARIGKKW